MNRADVERVLSTLRTLRDEHHTSRDRYERGMAAGFGIAVRALRELLDDDEAAA